MSDLMDICTAPIQAVEQHEGDSEPLDCTPPACESIHDEFRICPECAERKAYNIGWWLWQSRTDHPDHRIWCDSELRPQNAIITRYLSDSQHDNACDICPRISLNGLYLVRIKCNANGSDDEPTPASTLDPRWNWPNPLADDHTESFWIEHFSAHNRQTRCPHEYPHFCPACNPNSAEYQFGDEPWHHAPF